MKKIILILCFMNLIVSCNTTDKPENESKIQKSDNEINNIEESIKLEDILVVNIGDTSSVNKIKGNCVFFSQLTTKESDSLEKANPEFYESLSEELNNNANNAKDLFEKYKIKNYWSDKRYIYYKTGGKEFIIDTRKKDIKTYCIVFKVNNKPELLSIEPLEEDSLIKYFKR